MIIINYYNFDEWEHIICDNPSMGNMIMNMLKLAKIKYYATYMD